MLCASGSCRPFHQVDETGVEPLNGSIHVWTDAQTVVRMVARLFDKPPLARDDNLRPFRLVVQFNTQGFKLIDALKSFGQARLRVCGHIFQLLDAFA